MGVFFFVLALLAPFLTIDVPWAGEVWLFQSIQELSRSFGPVPTLNGAPFTGPGRRGLPPLLTQPPPPMTKSQLSRLASLVSKHGVNLALEAAYENRVVGNGSSTIAFENGLHHRTASALVDAGVILPNTFTRAYCFGAGSWWSVGKNTI